MALSQVSSCIKKTRHWATYNYVQFQEEKTYFILVHSDFSKIKPFGIPLLVGETQIIPSPTKRNLGVILDYHPNIEDFIKLTCRSTFNQLSRIGRIRRHLSNQ
jgi:hypothetical protein